MRLAHRVLAAALLAAIATLASENPYSITGRVLDPQANAVPNVPVTVTQQSSAHTTATTSANAAGEFQVTLPGPGTYTFKAAAPGFQDALSTVAVTQTVTQLDLRLSSVAERHDIVNVSADTKEAGILFPDPAQRVYVRNETLDANPGRPGAPISIPGVPIETASGGIKAPQYFAPGVAGDHGEPIAEYIQVGSYLASNNLSSNAHGNGYADPNILVPAVLEGVQTDGGAFNVREGNHAENLSAIYLLRSRLEPFVIATGDYPDADLTLGWSPEGPTVKSWVALESAYGNGFLNRLEHRQQYKLNGYREWTPASHLITLFGIAYYGQSFIPGLVPLAAHDSTDTVDRRQKDQTHTGEIALNDDWRITPSQHLRLSGMFRTYNLALYSNFGDGLIRQSEFRTVTGGNATYTAQVHESLSFLAGVDYQRDAPRRLDLDRYLSSDPSVYGPFSQVSANNVTLADSAPYLSLDGSFGHHLHYNLGWRRDQIQFANTDLLNESNSFSTLSGFNSPKATISFLPGRLLLPSVAFSFGEAFYTNDPRIGSGTARGTPISREHSFQLVLGKEIAGVDLRATLGHVTTEATLAKIDPDTGLQQDQGPGRNLFLTIAARRDFHSGFLQASISKADARDLDSGLPTPEAPRTIVDVLATYNQLPFRLQARAEFEQVGRKPLGDGFISVPVREFRGALVRSLRRDRIDVGLNFLIAGGYTGQTTEVIQALGQDSPQEQVVGVRLPSYVSLSYTYRFRHP